MKTYKKVFKSIDDIPLWNWIRFTETGRYIYLTDVDDHDVIIEPDETLLSAERNIYKQIFEQIGISDKYRHYLLKQKDLAGMEIELELTGDRKLETFIAIANHEIKDILSELQSGDVDETIIILEKFFGFIIDVKKISVKKYYSYIRLANKSNGKG